MKSSPLIFLPALVLSMAAAPVSRGELALLRGEIVATYQTLATRTLSRENRNTERQDPGKHSADRSSSLARTSTVTRRNQETKRQGVG